MILSKFKPSKPTALVEQAKEEKQHSLSKDSGVLKQKKPLQLRQKQFQIKKTKLNNEAYSTPAPQKSRELFFSKCSTQGCTLEKIRFLPKNNSLFNKFYLYLK